MKKFLIIGTWRMSFQGMHAGINSRSKTIKDFIKNAIVEIEDYPLFKSVGRGGLPNWKGFVELDAGYMDGSNKSYGAVMGVRNVANPIEVAIELSKTKYNRMLSGKGAEIFAMEKGFKTHKLETQWSLKQWEKKVKEMKENSELTPYAGHDTVCFVGTDTKSEMIAATSTSGLFMKRQGRVGDSPLIGSGFYADNNIGAAAATGLGEDIARGVLSLRVVDLMEKGLSPKQAVTKVLNDFTIDMKKRGVKVGAISLIAVDKEGEWGIASNCLFQFSVYKNDFTNPKLYISKPSQDGKNVDIIEAQPGYWEEYVTSLKNR